MKLIDSNIKKAIEDAVHDHGSILALSKCIGVSHSTIIFWLNGKTRSIDGDIWRFKVFPMLENHLARHGVYFDDMKASPQSGKSCRYTQKSDNASGHALHEVPVITQSNAHHYDPAFESFRDFAAANSTEKAFFASHPKDGYLAMRLEQDNHEIALPKGALLLVAGNEYAENGDTVIAKLFTPTKILIGKYIKDGDKVSLAPLSSNGEPLTWNSKDRKQHLQWVYPVTEAKIELKEKRPHKGNSDQHNT